MKIKIIYIEYSIDENSVFNPIYYFLKSFYLKNGRNNDSIYWLRPSYEVENISSILSETPDIICFSLYSWNQEESSKIAREIKNINPAIKMIIGGPQVSIRQKVFEKFDWADYAIYGDGEEAFQLLIDGIIDNDISDCINLITREKVYPHKIMKFKNFVEYSPYLDLKDEFEQDIFTKKQKYSNLKIAYQRVRGCPFKCSFCDWQGSLHYKVNVRNTDWKAELDFLSDLGCSVRSIDANFGIYDEDMDLLKYSIDLYREKKNGFFFQPKNFSKVKKDKVYYMLDMILDSIKDTDPFHPFLISLQDIDEEVLNNINRPDLEWTEHKKYLLNIRKKYKFANLIPELILGLPGFNIENYKNQLLEFASILSSPVQAYDWAYLVESPAVNKDYLMKYDLNVYDSLFLKKEPKEDISFKNMLNDSEKYFVKERYIIPNGELRNIIKAKAYNTLYAYCSNYMWRNILVGKNKNINEKTSYNFTKMIFNKLEKEIDILVEKIFIDIKQRLDEYNILVYCYKDSNTIISVRNFFIKEIKKILIKADLKYFEQINGWNNTFWDYKIKNNIGVL